MNPARQIFQLPFTDKAAKAMASLGRVLANVLDDPSTTGVAAEAARLTAEAMKARGVNAHIFFSFCWSVWLKSLFVLVQLKDPSFF